MAGLCANVAAAVYFAAAVDSFSGAADAFASNNTDAANSLFSRGNQKVQIGSDANSAQNFCEAVVLLIIILAFAVAGLAGDRRLSSALVQVKNNEHVEAAGRQLRRQIVGSTANQRYWLCCSADTTKQTTRSIIALPPPACSLAYRTPHAATATVYWYTLHRQRFTT